MNTNLNVTNVQTNNHTIYNRAKIWQIALFVLNNTATNVTMVLMGFYAFFTQNVLGLSAIIVGTIATTMRIWDAVTDPIIGFLLDKTNTKFGKFRPFMLIGNIIMFFSIYAIFHTPLEYTVGQKYNYTTIWYVIFIIGYTFQTCVTKGAQAALTNDPGQRPIFSLFDSIYNAILFSLATFIITTVMAPKYPKKLIDPDLWKDVSLMFMIVSFALTILAIIGIWQKDRTEFFGLGKNNVKVKFKDYIDILKNNRPIQMLTIAASTDKLALVAVRAGLVYFFANILLNSSLQGKYSLYATAPTLLASFVGVGWARKVGIKKAFVVSTWISLLMLFLLIATAPILAKPTWGTSVLILLILMALQSAAASLAGNIVIPMIADCSDYETYRSGRFIPGMMGTLFSFVDKIISSFSTFIVGAAIAWAGYGNTKIVPNTPVNNKMTLAIYFIIWGLPILGHIASIIAMKFYILDAPMMEKIKKEIYERKQAGSEA